MNIEEIQHHLEPDNIEMPQPQLKWAYLLQYS